MASRPTISSRPPTGTAANPVRRNLFQGHLIRRPTGASASTSATTLNEARQEDRNDILVKDRNGNAQVQTLLPPSLDEDRPQEEEEDLRTDKEKMEEHLLEVYKSRNIVPGDPAELLSAIRSSLRRKVAALEDDNWMFEAEETGPQ